MPPPSPLVLMSNQCLFTHQPTFQVSPWFTCFSPSSIETNLTPFCSKITARASKPVSVDIAFLSPQIHSPTARAAEQSFKILLNLLIGFVFRFKHCPLDLDSKPWLCSSSRSPFPVHPPVSSQTFLLPSLPKPRSLCYAMAAGIVLLVS